MNAGSSHGCPPKWFLWGAVLAGISSIPFIILFLTRRERSQEKATALGAVAGGLTEAYATFGLILTFSSWSQQLFCSVDRSPEGI